MYTQRHYASLAMIIQHSWQTERIGHTTEKQHVIDETYNHLIASLMSAFSGDNPNFNAARFVRAATPDEVFAREVNAPIQG